MRVLSHALDEKACSPPLMYPEGLDEIDNAILSPPILPPPLRNSTMEVDTASDLSYSESESDLEPDMSDLDPDNSDTNADSDSSDNNSDPDFFGLGVQQRGRCRGQGLRQRGSRQRGR